MSADKSLPGRPDYGIDAPGVVRNNILIGAAVGLIGLFLYQYFQQRSPGFAQAALGISLGVALSLWVTSGVMIHGSKVSKLRLRDRLLDQFVWRGDELVLDVGCGRGLFLIGAARRVPRGKVVGIDLWHSEDQSGNHAETTWANARAEGVQERIEIETADARLLPFKDNSFDRVVSSWVIHNIYNREGRERALLEILRVLKPGGQLAIADIEHTREYEQVFRQAGLQEIRREGPYFIFMIPTFTLTVNKAA